MNDHHQCWVGTFHTHLVQVQRTVQSAEQGAQNTPQTILLRLCKVHEEINNPLVRVRFDASKLKPFYAFQQECTSHINECDMPWIWPLFFMFYPFQAPCDNIATTSLISWVSCWSLDPGPQNGWREKTQKIETSPGFSLSPIVAKPWQLQQHSPILPWSKDGCKAGSSELFWRTSICWAISKIVFNLCCRTTCPVSTEQQECNSILVHCKGSDGLMIDNSSQFTNVLFS